jgi:glycosyltransferase involved in cell wall biosynthesis
MSSPSIFEQYYSTTEFHDRFAENRTDAITVIIPTVHTNELWRANLLSIYREVPVKQLLIGDGGCIDNTIEIAKEFPRVVIHDHRNYKSLGFSIKKLIEAVETEWFIYLHSDVYLPEGWFDKMNSHKGQYDWYGCRMKETILVELDHDYGERPYAGSQMGRKAAFLGGLERIEDDYVYRQEDAVFSDVVAKGGFKEGRIDEVFHYHQIIKNPSPVYNPKHLKVVFSSEMSKQEEFRIWNTQFRGIIKYLSPSSDWVIKEAGISAFILISSNSVTASELFNWVEKTNPTWLPYVKLGFRKHRLRWYLGQGALYAKAIVRAIFRL